MAPACKLLPHRADTSCLICARLGYLAPAYVPRVANWVSVLRPDGLQEGGASGHSAGEARAWGGLICWIVAWEGDGPWVCMLAQPALSRGALWGAGPTGNTRARTPRQHSQARGVASPRDAAKGKRGPSPVTGPDSSHLFMGWWFLEQAGTPRSGQSFKSMHCCMSNSTHTQERPATL